MIVYKDKRLCDYWKSFKIGLDHCDRALYPAVLEKAKKWSLEITNDPSILLIDRYTEIPKCWKKSEKYEVII
jgi:hypothetical protein